MLGDWVTSKIPQKERRQTSGQMIRQPGNKSRDSPMTAIANAYGNFQSHYVTS